MVASKAQVRSILQILLSSRADFKIAQFILLLQFICLYPHFLIISLFIAFNCYILFLCSFLWHSGIFAIITMS